MKIEKDNFLENDKKLNNPASIENAFHVKYENPITNKVQSQSGINMPDEIIPVILKEKNGKIYFALQYSYIPAINGITLELPAYISDKKNKGQHSDKEIKYSISNEMNNIYGLEVERYKNIEDKSPTPISQSFTNQMGNFIIVKVIDSGKIGVNNLRWYPISQLESLLEKSSNIPMSIQSQYGLRILYNMAKENNTLNNQLKDEEKFKPEEELLSKEFNNYKWDKEVMKNKYRFGIQRVIGLPEEVSKLSDKGKINVLSTNATYYATSKNSAQVVLVREKNGKKQVGLVTQLRSPFLAEEKVDPIFLEVPAGMLEDGETYEDAALREAKEETGIEMGGLIPKRLLGPQLLSYATQEKTAIYLIELPSAYKQNEQKLDNDEVISDNIQWLDLSKLSIKDLHSPLPTKLALLLAKEFYKKIRVKEDKER